MWAGKGCPLTQAKHFWPLKNNSLQIHLETSQISSQTQMAKQKKAFCHPQRVGNSFCLCCTFVVTRFSPSSLTWNWSPEWWQTSPPLNPEKPEKPGPVSRAPSNEGSGGSAGSHQSLKQAAHLVPEDQGHHSTCQLDQQADAKDVHELQENKC